MCKNSSSGTSLKSCGSRWLLPFLLAFSLFSASSLSAQTPQVQPPQTTPSNQYSTMTREELLKQIESKDSLLAEWLMWQEKEKTLQAERDKASSEQLASRDKEIFDQAQTIKAVTGERDQAKAELGRQKVMGWLEKVLYGLGGAGAGYAVGHFAK